MENQQNSNHIFRANISTIFGLSNAHWRVVKIAVLTYLAKCRPVQCTCLRKYKRFSKLTCMHVITTIISQLKKFIESITLHNKSKCLPALFSHISLQCDVHFCWTIGILVVPCLIVRGSWQRVMLTSVVNSEQVDPSTVRFCCSHPEGYPALLLVVFNPCLCNFFRGDCHTEVSCVTSIYLLV